ncbi:hypothetical protein KAJ83_04440 [Marivibrio halodurans]|uniref:Uncharacterized protein n=1 Tax=Marivibrio halodurans TaxID=2039722 RepID=A0A8J7V007_9PROT|nr:hypothetical protein [Marivibrio halodurans]MBP5856246.1 hypothetical protein [Marivibrio halodurans]
MSPSQKDSDNDPRPVLAIIAAIICGIAGYDVGQWGGAIAAAVIAFGGVYMLFAAIVIGIKLAIGGAIFLMLVVALKNRWDWLSSLFQ